MDYRLGWPSLGLVASLGLLPALPASPVYPQDQPLAHRVIIIHRPTPWPHPWPYPQPQPPATRVRVEFDALGTDWGAVYLDGRLIYQPHNFNRRHTVHLQPGGYRLEVTGVVRSDRWASGYLDIGRDNSQIVVIRFSKTGGVSVSGSPEVWIPD
ncbi:hypothetical protein GFS31_13360 [Leptolyngbya sp. BL0902]|uniref:hypothetical protein n=1 Tax=Leptolyngbya sp. BL0902 TaxID=1115757 RepID=UPI0018E792C4|nr:hypothetical protein [Leptolyngbya sp. BL0902]QQE64655.1 hypothetical protein GFS31_13360 [Leptolyngbya sp. BL0902]